MIPVMIVDDEKLLRSLIIRSIDWQKIGLSVVCEASDGEEALVAIEEFHPAIAIVDINMPFMNGLELTRIISEKYPGIQVIILTGYSEFEYARDAIRAKAMNYITKPIDDAELTSALIAAGDAVRSIEEGARQLTKLETEAFRGQIAAQDKYLRLLFNGQQAENDAQIAASLDAWGFNFNEKDLMALVVSVENSDSMSQDDKDAVYMQFAIANIAQEIFSENHVCAALLEVDLTIVLLIGIDRSAGEVPLTPIQADCQRILQLAGQYVQIKPTIALGSIQTRLSDVPKSFGDAVQNLRQRFYQPDAILVGTKGSRSPSGSQNGGAWPIADFITIMTKLRLGDQDACLNSIAQIFDHVGCSRLPEDYARSLAMNLLSICFAFMAEKQMESPQGTFTELMTRIRMAVSLDQLSQLLRNLYGEVLKQTHSDIRLLHLHPMVRKALEEIDHHYDSSNLTLELIAKSIYVNPTYLSSLFRNDMGKTMTEYLIEYRMSMAYRLIMTENRREIAEIAAAVGYRDVYYFSRCFRKHFGIAPTHCRLAQSASE